MSSLTGKSGMTWLVVTVEEIDGNDAHCVDQHGIARMFDTRVMRANGAKPRVGEKWVADRSILGNWTLAAVLQPKPTKITGSRSTGAALANLLTALDEMGLIEDGTTP